MRRRVLWIAFLVLFGPLLRGQETDDPSLLTLDRIFVSREFSAHRANAAQWLKDVSAFTRLETVGESQNIVKYDPETGSSEVLVSSDRLIPPGESTPLHIDDYQWSVDGSLVLIYTNSKAVWRRKTRGDYWVFDLTSRELIQLGGGAAASSLMFAKFSPTGRRVAYVREKNLYVEDLVDQNITPLTRDGSGLVINGTGDWVYEEELGLRDGFRWSPDGSAIAFWQLDTEGVREFYLINNTDSLYPRIIPIQYPKVGEQNPAARLAVVDSQGGNLKWMEVPGDPRNHYISRMEWASSSEEIVIQQLNRLQNTLKVLLADRRTGKVRTVLTEAADAWIDVDSDLRWIKDGSYFTWSSERDGWRHLYLVSRSGEEARLLTSGDYDTIGVQGVDEKNGWLYFIASPSNPTQRYLYRVALAGGTAERVTPRGQTGTHTYSISDRAGWAFHTYSSFDAPPRTELVSLPEHRTVRTIEDNATLAKKLSVLKKSPTEFTRINIGGGVILDAWLMKPRDFDPAETYPLLIYVYGEPAGQTVLDRWGGNRYLWHLLLTQRGYLVLSIDNRGTPSPRGREWRKIIYRQVGILASSDQARAARAFMAKSPYVDAARIGIWGWSGGGSMSLNAIFRYPDLYHTAMAVAPVSNQRFYDTIYQERYMGLPNDNVEGFMKGSPITYAHQLKGNLLLVHGTGDDNVHYQSTEALVNELIAHNKQFSMMTYPNRTHTIREGSNTQRHLFGLLLRYLTEKMPTGPH